MPRLRWIAALLGLTLGLVVSAVAVTPAYAIANGTPVAEGRYGFSVKLTMTDIPRPDGTHYNSACSAALVSPLWIVTAGHCFHDVNRKPVSGRVPYPTTATVGRTDLSNTNGYVVNVTEVRQSSTEDVALAKLQNAVSGIAPVQLSTTTPKVGTVVRMTGWGATESVNPVPVTHLQTGQFTISKVTGTTVGVVGYLPAADTSACLYDSGGPYFVERPDGIATLVSVERDGPDCPHTQVETTSRIDKIAGWIRQLIG